MKKITIISIVLTLILIFSLASCTGEKAPAAQTQQSGTETNAPEEVKGQGAIKVPNEKGNEISVQINFATDVSQYSIVSSDDYKDIAEALSSKIEEKIGVKMAVSADAAGAKAINLAVSSELGADEYTIKSEGDVITLTAGGKDALSNAADTFGKYFVYAANKTILIPVGTGFENLIKYYANSITIDGVDISEFSLVKSEDDFTLYPEYLEEQIQSLSYELEDPRSLIKARELADILASDVIGVTLPVVEEKTEGGHYIELSANSTNVNAYSVKIENGNVYISGSYLSIDKAVEVFVSDIIGYNAESAEYDKTIAITSANSTEGSLGLAAPYTKDELLKAMNDAYTNDDMIIVGTHAYGLAYNGKDVAGTRQLFLDDCGKEPGLIELDLGQLGDLNNNDRGDFGLSEYDLSRIVSECFDYVSEGGIICLCAHTGNPNSTIAGTNWYKGLIGADAEFKKLYTEGTDLNKKMMTQWEPTFRLLKAFNDNGIPVIFRPLHEMQGDWFWWCIQQGNYGKLQSDTWIGLWKYLYNYVAKNIGNDYFLWNYSTTGSEIDYCYPGDEYVDIVGVDWYTNGNRELETKYPALMVYNKPAAITEVGYSDNIAKKDVTGRYYYNVTALDLFNDIKYLIEKDCDIAYFMTWAQFKSLAALDETDKVMNDPIVYTKDKMMEYWNNN